MSRSDLKGAVALVTGASSGIGEAIVQRLAREGLKLALVARRVDRLNELAVRVQAAGGEALPLVADLTQEADRARVIREVSDEWGPPDVLVNNAGLGWYGFQQDMPWAMARDMVGVNVTAIVHLTLLTLPAMVQRGSGHIVNISSVAGSIPSQGIALYGATKAFLDAFTRGLYRELKGSGVHVSTLKPGPVRDTEFYSSATARASGLSIPAERFGITAERVANTLWSLLRRPRESAYVPGVLRVVPWVELSFGWLIDRLGPLLLRRASSSAA